MDREQVKDNRARRKRESARQMRELLEQVAALGASTDESEPCGKAHACAVCGSLFECEPQCVVGKARRWLAVHDQAGVR